MTQDENKTKAQLIDELAELAKRNAELEKLVWHDTAEHKQTKEDLQRTTHDLEERIKELQCLYGIAALAADHDKPLEIILQGAVELIPPSWQYPDVTCARLTLGDKTYQTDRFDNTPYKQSANLVFNDEQLGVLDVYYIEEKPLCDEGPFLEEERNLIDDIADRLARVVGKRWMEDALKELHSHYQLLFTEMPNGFASHQIICDEDDIPVDYRFLEVNPAFEVLTGLRATDIVGKTVLEALPGVDSSWIEKYGRVAMTGEPTEFEQHFDLLNRYYHVKAFCPKERHFAVLFTDVSKNKQAEQDRLDSESQMQQAQKLESLGVLAGGIAHDFNNLLMGVLGNADLALSDLSPVAPARVSIEQVKAAATRAAELANQMLAYSGHGQFVVKPISLSEVVQEMGHLLNASIPKTTILKYQVDEVISPIEADVTQIRQVVMNLITNAAEALENQSGIVKLTTGVMECDKACQNECFATGECSLGLYSYLEVSDTGVGMDEETVSTMFDPFFTTKFTGRGLGLAATSGIVRGHNGAIKVESEPGGGTTIRVLFPITYEPIESLREKDKERLGPNGGGMILLVDDEPTVLDVGKRMLDMTGYEVLTARDGVEAVHVFKEHSQDIGCVILDLTMPKMNGDEVFDELQKIRSDVPVLLTSGYSIDDVDTRLSAKGFAGFINKPYTLSELRKNLREVLPE